MGSKRKSRTVLPLNKGPDARINRVNQALTTVPSRFQKLYARATQRQCSPKLAIKAKCLECCGYEEISSRIGGCTTFACPLWAYRPYQGE